MKHADGKNRLPHDTFISYRLCQKKSIEVEIQTQATRTINIIGMLLQNVLV